MSCQAPLYFTTAGKMAMHVSTKGKHAKYLVVKDL